MRSWLFCALLGATAFAGEPSRTTLGDPLDDLRRKADNGDAQAQWFLHLRYFLGTTPEGIADPALSIAWLRKAAEGGFTQAQIDLGKCYMDGKIVRKDLAEAAKWLRKAAEQGDPEAQFTLGGLLIFHESPLKNEYEGAKMFRKAAEQGYASAHLNLALMYLSGTGLPKDVVQAHLWANLSSALGNEEGKKLLTILEKSMPSEQKAEAMKLAREKWAELEAKKK